MSLNKAIKYGKEHRKEYDGAKSVDPMCRNHKGCKWCEDNRTYHNRKQIQKTNEQLKEVKTMSVIKNIDKIWQNMARQQLENELNFIITDDNKKIKLPIDDNIDYLKMYNDTHKTPEEELQDRIDKALELLDSYKLGKYDYALTPAGLLDFEDILRGKDEERNNRNTIKKSNL